MKGRYLLLALLTLNLITTAAVLGTVAAQNNPTSIYNQGVAAGRQLERAKISDHCKLIRKGLYDYARSICTQG